MQKWLQKDCHMELCIQHLVCCRERKGSVDMKQLPIQFVLTYKLSEDHIEVVGCGTLALSLPTCSWKSRRGLRP